MAAQFGGLFHHCHRQQRRHLLQPNGGAEPRRTGPDDQYVGLDDLAIAGVGHGHVHSRMAGESGL